MAKIFRSGNSKVVSLPESALRQLGLKTGDELLVKTLPDKIELVVSKKKKLPVSQEFALWAEGFITRYKTVLDELAKR